MKLANLFLGTLMATTLLTATVHAAVDKQFPEDDKDYRPGIETGFDQYKTASLKNSKKVALTFDDGPHAKLTPKFLDILKKYNVKATFFVLTENITPQTMPIVKRIIAEGHHLASHHHNHNNNNTKSEAAYKEELKNSIKMIAEIMEEENAPNRQLYYRFPYGAYGGKGLSYHHFNVMKDVSRELFGDNCINFSFWDIDSLDWLAPMSESDIASNVMAHIEGGTAYNLTKSMFGNYKKSKYTISKPFGGGVILMHDIHEKTLGVLEKTLQNFKNKGIEVVDLADIEEYQYGSKECRLK